MWIPVGVFLTGVACIAAAAISGEAEVQLFIVFPVISGSSLLFAIGVLLIVASFILGFVLVAMSVTEPVHQGPSGSTEDATIVPEAPQKKTRYGGVVLIGPVPIIFGSDRKMAWVMLLVAIVLAAIILAVALVSL